MKQVEIKDFEIKVRLLSQISSLEGISVYFSDDNDTLMVQLV